MAAAWTAWTISEPDFPPPDFGRGRHPPGCRPFFRPRRDRGSDDAIAAQPIQLRGVDAAKFAEHRRGMLAEQRRAGHLGWRIRQFDRTTDGPVAAARRIVEVEDHSPRREMR